MNDASDDERSNRLANVLGDTVAHAANEALILARLEEFLDPKPPQIAHTKEDEDDLNKNIDKLILAYGGPPRLVILADSDPKPTYDTYLSAAIDEAIHCFKRSRNSLCRAKAFLIGKHYLDTRPDILSLYTNLNLSDAPPDVMQFFLNETQSAFWEHTETCYIRIASYWDRVGQILDYVFFRIRKYERDGFSSVLDRICANTLCMHSRIKDLAAWEALWSHKKSEQEEGLQWLLSRRNLLVHSLYLRPIDANDGNELYESAFNHLDDRRREKLRVGSPEIEMNRLQLQMEAAAKLFPQVIALCLEYSQCINPTK